MKHSVLLTATSLLSILLFSLHVTEDIVRGFDAWGPQSLIGVLILVVWLHATLVVPETRWGLVIIIIGGLLAAAMPAIHRNFAKPAGAFFFIWTLFALGSTGTLSVILAVAALFRRRRGLMGQ